MAGVPVTHSVTRDKHTAASFRMLHARQNKRENKLPAERQKKKTNKTYPAACRLVGRGTRTRSPRTSFHPCPLLIYIFPSQPRPQAVRPFCLSRLVHRCIAGPCSPRWPVSLPIDLGPASSPGRRHPQATVLVSRSFPGRPCFL